MSDIIRVPQVFLDVCVFPLVNRSILMPFEMPWKTLAPEIKSAQVLRNDVLSTARGAFTYPKHLIMRNLTQTCISLFSITLRILFTNNSYLRTFVYIYVVKKNSPRSLERSKVPNQGMDTFEATKYLRSRASVQILNHVVLNKVYEGM